jgi:hypothetical protein
LGSSFGQVVQKKKDPWAVSLEAELRRAGASGARVKKVSKKVRRQLHPTPTNNGGGSCAVLALAACGGRSVKVHRAGEKRVCRDEEIYTCVRFLLPQAPAFLKRLFPTTPKRPPSPEPTLAEEEEEQATAAAAAQALTGGGGVISLSRQRRRAERAAREELRAAAAAEAARVLAGLDEEEEEAQERLERAQVEADLLEGSGGHSPGAPGSGPPSPTAPRLLLRTPSAGPKRAAEQAAEEEMRERLLTEALAVMDQVRDSNLKSTQTHSLSRDAGGSYRALFSPERNGMP